jgi:hypothetical protein
MLYESGNVSFLGDVADLDFDLVGRGDELLELGLSFEEGRLGDVSHEHVSALFGEENASLKTNATVGTLEMTLGFRKVRLERGIERGDVMWFRGARDIIWWLEQIWNSGGLLFAETEQKRSKMKQKDENELEMNKTLGFLNSPSSSRDYGILVVKAAHLEAVDGVNAIFGWGRWHIGCCVMDLLK